MHQSQIEDVRLADLVAYLRAGGWTQAGTYAHSVVWARQIAQRNVEVLVPESPEARDYLSRIEMVTETLSTVEDRPFAAILEDLLSPRVDVQHIRTMPDGPSGTIPLHEGYLAVKAINDLYLSAATATVIAERPLVLPGRRPPRAQGFLDNVRLGQTSKSSYGLRVEVPLPTAGATPLVSSRDVLRMLYQSASSAHDAATVSSEDNLEEFNERVGDGVSANLCAALADIGGLRRSPFELSFRWAVAEPLDEATPTLHFDSRLIGVLRHAARYLRDLPISREATIIGRVQGVRRPDAAQLGRVDLIGTVDAGDFRWPERRVTVRLAPDLYRTAISAHERRRPLHIRGTVRDTGSRIEVTLTESVEIIETD